MFIYIVSFLACFISSLIPSLRENKRWTNTLLSVLAIIMCFGYMTGSDWRSYERYYGWLSSPNPFEGLILEPGYILYSLLFERIGFSFWPFFIITKLLLFYLLTRTIKKYSVENVLLVVSFFSFFFGLFLFIDNPMRNLIAVGITIFSYKYLVERNFFSFLLIVLLATCFHLSALLLLFVYPFYPIKMGNKKLLFVYFLFNILFVLTYRFLLLKFIGLFSFIPLVELKMNSYFIDGDELTDNSLVSFGFIVQVLFFLMVIWKRKRIEAVKYGRLIFWGTICYLFLYRVGLVIDIFYRFQLYFSILYSIGICSIASFLIIRSNRLIYFSFLGFFLMFVTYKTITSSYKYIPYTNYIPYLFDSELPFDYRAQYNFIYSPYVRDDERGE